MKKNPMIMTIKQINDSPMSGLPDGSWHPAKPAAWIGMRFWNRVKAAWLVVLNKAVVVRWY